MKFWRMGLILNVVALLMSGAALSGCGLIAAGTVGGVAATELNENDNALDPLENTQVGEDVYNDTYGPGNY